MRWNLSQMVSPVQDIFAKHANLSHGEKRGSTMDEIRKAMLEALGEPGAKANPIVQIRLTCASDIQDLWYLRGDVMGVLADFDGEAIAKSKIAQISAMFQGLLPPGLHSRPSPLAN